MNNKLITSNIYHIVYKCNAYGEERINIMSDTLENAYNLAKELRNKSYKDYEITEIRKGNPIKYASTKTITIEI